jgi:hypothetical protein
MTYPRDKAIEVEPGEDKVDQAEEARRTESGETRALVEPYSRSANLKPRKNSKMTPIAGRRESPVEAGFRIGAVELNPASRLLTGDLRGNALAPPEQALSPFVSGASSYVRSGANAVGIKAAWS